MSMQHCFYCDGDIDTDYDVEHFTIGCPDEIAEPQEVHYKSLLDYYKQEVVPLAQELSFYERIPAQYECEVCDWTEDLIEIEYVEDDPDQSFYFPNAKTKAVLCSTHAGKRIKRLDDQGIGYEIHAIVDNDRELLMYEVEKGEEL